MNSLPTYTDIDECEVDNGGCEEMCVNTPGSYHCLCPRGFILQDDNHTCEGIISCPRTIICDTYLFVLVFSLGIHCNRCIARSMSLPYCLLLIYNFLSDLAVSPVSS